MFYMVTWWQRLRKRHCFCPEKSHPTVWLFSTNRCCPGLLLGITTPSQQCLASVMVISQGSWSGLQGSSPSHACAQIDSCYSGFLLYGVGTGVSLPCRGVVSIHEEECLEQCLEPSNCTRNRISLFSWAALSLPDPKPEVMGSRNSPSKKAIASPTLVLSPVN